jgi:hypothetical protein
MANRILLVTLNAKYIHASLGLRYLQANMQRYGGEDLSLCTTLHEFTIHSPPSSVAQALIAACGDPQPDAVHIIGFGVYIWNVEQTLALMLLLREYRPDIRLVLGGPEVSHEWEKQSIVACADFVITGWGDLSFPRLCRALVHGPRPLMKVIAGEQPPLSELNFPYEAYSAEDLAHRVIYVEASRGCPFKCAFCLSALDKTAWAFELEPFLGHLNALHQRGARTFKFVDRTFNLKVETSVRILEFFLDLIAQNPSEKLFVHFELIPDHLPESLKSRIARFPAGNLQFEIGIQSLNPEVQKTISRRQDTGKAQANVQWLVAHSKAHLHTDLIFGLPGESWDSFAAGFDALWSWGPHEIQLGLLKRLRGTPLAMAAGQDMVFQDLPPYSVVQTNTLTRDQVERFVRLARYWDLVANSGRFSRTLPLLLAGTSAFAGLARFTDWFWARTGSTSGITPEMLVDALFDFLTQSCGLDPSKVRAALLEDYRASGARAKPYALRSELTRAKSAQSASKETTGKHSARQNRHLAGLAPSL